MEMQKQEDDNMKALQKNLGLIRRVFGWTSEELAEKIGIARQTVKNIEKNDSKLSKTQYLAIKEVFWEEIMEIMKKSEESSTTISQIETMLKNPEIYPEEVKMLASVLSVVMNNSANSNENKTILETADKVAPTLVTKTNSRKAVSKEFLKKVGIVAGGIITSGVIVYFLKGKNKN